MEELKDTLFRCLRAMLVNISSYRTNASKSAVEAYRSKLSAAVKQDPEVERYLSSVLNEVYSAAIQHDFIGNPSDWCPWPLSACLGGGYDYYEFTPYAPRPSYRFTGTL